MNEPTTTREVYEKMYRLRRTLAALHRVTLHLEEHRLKGTFPGWHLSVLEDGYEWKVGDLARWCRANGYGDVSRAAQDHWRSVHVPSRRPAHELTLHERISMRPSGWYLSQAPGKSPVNVSN